VSKLTVEWQANGKSRKKEVDIRNQLTIGRHPACDIILGDPHVSRRHATIYYQDGTFHIQNLSDTNPVVINDRWTLAQNLGSDLKPGDSITVGLVRLKISLIKLSAKLGELYGTDALAGIMYG
jgi:predicted component of type VI protein secretion system